MINFLLCVGQYLLIMAVLIAIGAVGAKIGITLRKKKNAKTQDEIEES